MSGCAFLPGQSRFTFLKRPSERTPVFGMCSAARQTGNSAKNEQHLQAMEVCMSRLALPAIFVLATLAMSCGGVSTSDPSRTLVSIQVTPSAATGQAQFTAIGTFSDGSKAPVTALWTLNPPFTLTPATPVPGWISLSSTGKAQCTGAAGNPIAGIWATAPVDPRIPISKMTMNTKNVSGTAQLTCS